MYIFDTHIYMYHCCVFFFLWGFKKITLTGYCIGDTHDHTLSMCRGNIVEMSRIHNPNSYMQFS